MSGKAAEIGICHRSTLRHGIAEMDGILRKLLRPGSLVGLVWVPGKLAYRASRMWQGI
jgi:hypothetical protein